MQIVTYFMGKSGIKGKKYEPVENFVFITYATSEGSGQPGQMRSLTRAIVVCTHKVEM